MEYAHDTSSVKRLWEKSPDLYTPAKLQQNLGMTSTFDFQQVAMPMVYPTTGETISSYKRLMHDPDTAETWQTAFGKDFKQHLGKTSEGWRREIRKLDKKGQTQSS